MTRCRLENRTGRIPAALHAEHEATLLGVARDLFYERGFDGTSIDAIARAAHVSPKTIYGRFGGKEGIFGASIRARAEAALASLSAPIASSDDVRAALVDFATRLLTATTSAEALLIQRLVIAQSERFPELGVEFFEMGPKRGIATLAAFFERAAATGFLEHADAQTAAEMFVGALLGVPLRAALIVHARLSRKAIAQRANEVAALFLSAYSPMPKERSVTARPAQAER